MSSTVVLLDTSILLNVYDVPGRNAQRESVFDQLRHLINQGDHLILPVASIFEVGNLIAQAANGQARRAAADRFVAGIQATLNGQAPWKPMRFPSPEDLAEWLESFPDRAMEGIGMGDLSIIKEWESCCRLFAMSRVRIWSLDEHLQGYDRMP